MKSKAEHTYDYPLETIVSLFTQKSYVEDQFKKGGNDYVVTEIVDDEKLFRMRVERKMDLQSASMPGPLKKMVGSNGRMFSLTEWDSASDGKVQGRTEMEMEGVPVSFIVLTTLTPRGEKTHALSNIEIKAKIPMVGKQIEKYLLPKAKRGVDRAYDRACKHLASI